VQYGRVAQAHFFFPLEGAHRTENTTVVIHRDVKKRGCPTRRFYAWVLVSCRKATGRDDYLGSPCRVIGVSVIYLIGEKSESYRMKRMEGATDRMDRSALVFVFAVRL
jgi:hypothetical protein